MTCKEGEKPGGPRSLACLPLAALPRTLQRRRVAPFLGPSFPFNQMRASQPWMEVSGACQALRAAAPRADLLLQGHECEVGLAPGKGRVDS